MKIYIAGPMSGIQDFNRFEFNLAAARHHRNGHVALNPAILPDGLSQAEYMDICLAMLRCADVIYLLSGWEESPGARAEKALAEKLELKVICQGEDSP
ncbi:DUF4406 domain-containing protein [Siccibacter colletis]|uniref:DUF4406 domain-containing protein n=1 Tax=Siccibacter colletis TaxID=1505757 RepID=UPI0004E0CE55|nr:DUF4406 domain-containing protein [Siccibacter colletis]